MYRTILVPLDGSAFGEYALPLALSIARRSGASVQLAHVHTPETYVLDLPPSTPPHGLSRASASAYLTELAKALSPRWAVPISVVMLDGGAVDELYTHAIAAGADLVVMTTHGHGPLSRMWMGSVADKLMRRLPMPVVLTRPHEEALDLLEQVRDRVFEHILIPLDGSALAEEILASALALGTPSGTRYTLLQAINPPVLGYAPAAYAVGLDQQILEQWRAEAQVYLDQVADRLRSLGHQADTHISIAPPALAILDYARDHAVDLVALATHGRGGLTRLLLGSVADKVVRGAGTPVLLQRPRAEQADQPLVSGPVAEHVTAKVER
jgi:nucleotide-binding universal stress UspA family protein